LAEVLITLAIIGVIAAITIPSIVANHQKTALEAQFAKSYRTLSQAVSLAIAEHGDISSWDWENNTTAETRDKFVKTYFSPYLNIIKYCPSDNSVKGCFSDDDYLYLNGTKMGNINNEQFPKALLADGSSVKFTFMSECMTDNNRCLGVQIDINGSKKPNAYGRDLFSFSFYPKTSEFLPHGVNSDVKYNEDTKTYTKNSKETILQSCTTTGQGGFCAARVVIEGFKINY